MCFILFFWLLDLSLHFGGAFKWQQKYVPTLSKPVRLWVRCECITKDFKLITFGEMDFTTKESKFKNVRGTGDFSTIRAMVVCDVTT